MTIEQYIKNINAAYTRGTATEHTYRGDLKQLIETIIPDITATNEPKRIACGAPDYVLTNAKDIPVGFIEAKDIGDKDLLGEKKTGNKEQFDRYKTSLNNLIFTDYIDFHIYRNGILTTKIAIAEASPNPSKGGELQIIALPQNFATFTNLLKDFCSQISQTITSPKKLAEMMAGKARLLADVIEKALLSDEDTHENSTLKDQLQAFKEILIHDITPKSFADVYAQTIAYGMFAARYHDSTLPTFSRQEAYELIPKSNPFLKKLFGYIAGLDVDDRIKWIVDDLVNIFLACDVAEILKDYGKATKMEDPIIHFYETFLSEYDANLRKARGVWYTPAPVVNFIVRAVDDILKTELDLPQGLADTSKIKSPLTPEGGTSTSKTPPSGAGGLSSGLHKVQILDPATGTGTFLAEVVKHIHKKFVGQQGIWTNYVENHLLPRLNGFELLMASYAMAHLQLDLLLTDTGYKTNNNQRLRVYLTNSLEEGNTTLETGFANWLSTEANEANHIKRDTPVMCIIGNPPYAVSSTNKGEWIQSLIADYKKNLNERKINLDDDYIKFIRFGQHFIDKNGSGILAYISNNSFIDGITHRQMRKHLLESFDKIYILDLHGNAKKKEVCPDGSPDQNVFDIMQGVSINIFVKTGKKKKGELGQVFHYDLQGKREFKYDFLNENSLKSLNWKNILLQEPYNFFVNLDYSVLGKYEQGFQVSTLFSNYNSGIQTKRDELTINATIAELKNKLLDFQQLSTEEIRNKYNLPIDGRDWTIEFAKKDLLKGYSLIPIQYRIFDIRYTAYTGRSKGFIAYPRETVSSHFVKDNIGLVFKRTGRIYGSSYDFFFISNHVISEGLFAIDPLGREYIAPLYLYPEIKGETELLENRNSLELRLEESQIIFENFEKGFLKVKKMYEALPKPDSETKKYFKSQEVFRNKLKTNIELFKQQLAAAATQNLFEEEKRRPNLNKEIVANIAEKLGLRFTSEKETNKDTFAPIDLLDYIYAVLHSPTYREKYKEFLKIDFPRVPYPSTLTPEGGIEETQKKFWTLVSLGSQLRQIHLLESPTVEKFITTYPVDGTNLVGKVVYENNKVYINYDKTPPSGWSDISAGGLQYFDNVPEIAWNFYIGGYQPAQKWLKDRKDRKLEFDDILHYQKIIVALTETDRLMKEIDKIEIE